MQCLILALRLNVCRQVPERTAVRHFKKKYERGFACIVLVPVKSLNEGVVLCTRGPPRIVKAAPPVGNMADREDARNEEEINC